MNTFDLVNIYSNLHELLIKLNNSIKGIKDNYYEKLEPKHKKLIMFILDTNLTNNHIGTINTHKRNFLVAAKEFVNSINLIELVSQLSDYKKDFEQKIINMDSSVNFKSEEVYEFIDSLQKFLESVHECLTSDLPGCYFIMISDLLMLLQANEMLNRIMDSLLSNISSTPIERENYDPDKLITLKLYGKNYRLHDFAVDIKEVNEIYSSLVHALELEDPNELEIVKVESGSLSLAAIGGKVASVLFVFVIDRIAQKHFGNYFKSKSDSIIDEQTIMLNHLELIEKYKSLTGKDYEDSEETKNKLISVIRKSERLIKKNPAVMINGTKFGVFVDNFQTHIQYEKQLLIENSNQ